MAPRRRKLRIVRFRLKPKVHSLRCSSSPHATRFAGLARGSLKGKALRQAACDNSVVDTEFNRKLYSLSSETQFRGRSFWYFFFQEKVRFFFCSFFLKEKGTEKELYPRNCASLLEFDEGFAVYG